ncbi:hypothetical protein RA993_23280, partial [Mycobacteroides abscessus subsp. abscessus]
MAQSWSAAQLTVLDDYTAAPGSPDEDLWSEVFDTTHQQSEAAIEAIEAIISDPQKQAALSIAVPPQVWAVVADARNTLAFKLFSPVGQVLGRS